MTYNPTRNIASLYLIKISHWFLLFMPIVVLFFEKNGLNLQQVFLVQAVHSVSVVLLEIPSGYFADVWGRRNTLIVGTIIAFFGYLVMAVSFQFCGFALAMLLIGTGGSFVSGSDSALLYDTLLWQKAEKSYLRHEGRLISAGNFAEALAAIIGGFLATYSLRYPYYGQVILAFAAIPAAVLCTEPPVHKDKRKASFSDIFKILHYALFKNKILKQALLFSSVSGAATLTMAWLVQPYFKAVEVPLKFYGILWTVLNLSVGLVSMWAYKVDSRFGNVKTLFLILLGLSLGFLLAGATMSLWGIGFIFLFYLVRGIATPVLKDRINRLTSSEIRATVLSVRSFIIRMIFAGFGPFIGWWSDHFSLKTAFLLTGSVYAFSGLLFILFYLTALKKRQFARKEANT